MRRFDTIAIALFWNIVFAALCYLLWQIPPVDHRRFLWIGNPANVETWNGACLDLETRQIVPSIHCEQ